MDGGNVHFFFFYFCFVHLGFLLFLTWLQIVMLEKKQRDIFVIRAPLQFYFVCAFAWFSSKPV